VIDSTGRRNRVAGHQEQRVRVLGPDRLRQCQHASQAARRALIDGRELVDVVHLQQRDFDVAVLLLRGDRKQSCEQKEEGERCSAE
jgi:hypothetical protein